MGTARTSPKVVRERRVKGISSNRGKVRRHFPKANRNDRHLEAVARDAKVWEPSNDLEQAIERLLIVRPPPADLREEVEQELWVRLLGGETEDELRESLGGVVKQVKAIEWASGQGHLSLDAPLSESGEGALTMADMVDTEGVYHRSRARVISKKPMDRCDCGRPCSQDAIRCKQCVREEAEQRLADQRELVALGIAERELKRDFRRAARDEKRRIARQRLAQVSMARRAELAERRAAFESQRIAFLADRTCECGGYRTKGATICLDCWRRDSGTTVPDYVPVASHLGVKHRPSTIEKMSASRRRSWASEYGERRRAALNVTRMVCRKCGFDGPLEDFAKNPHAYRGRDKICKPCMVVQTREYKQRRKQLGVGA